MKQLVVSTSRCLRFFRVPHGYPLPIFQREEDPEWVEEKAAGHPESQ